MALQDRKTLKGFFNKGARPTEGHFHDLIDSMSNILDDHLSTENDGNSGNVASVGTSKVSNLATFFEKTAVAKKDHPSLFSQVENDPQKGLSFKEASNGNPVMHLNPGGNVGIGTVAPLYKLHVDGTVAAPSRVGTYADKSINTADILANGKWQKIITGLDGLNAFEIVASVSGEKGSGNYGLLHAIALSAYGDSKSSINESTARFKGLFKNLEIRWTGTTHNYNLEIRTTSDLGAGIKIKYNITKLISE